MIRFLRVLVPFLSVGPALALQDVPRLAPAPISGHGLGLERVFLDEPGDGRIWARSESYKASFGSEGATFIPFLGSKAPRNFPVGFRLLGHEAQVAPGRSQAGGGERIEYDRGSVVERYDLALDSMEQSFVLREWPAAGDFALHIGFETELAASAEDGGIRFSNDLGGVLYGHATAIDATGRSTDVPALLHESEIELIVPAAFLAQAQGPITVDPVINSFVINPMVGVDERGPDTAYDLTTDHYMVVHNVLFSSTDWDVMGRILDSGGTNLVTFWVDTSAIMWKNPRVANNGGADQFMTVAQVDASGSWTVMARTAAASNATLGTPVLVSGIEAGSKITPDIGGDPDPLGTTYYCVVWENEYSNLGDIHFQLVRPDGTNFFAQTMALANDSSDEQFPRISKSDGNVPASARWNIAWKRVISASNEDIYAAQIRRDGFIISGAFAVSTAVTTLDVVAYPSSLDDAENWMCAWTRELSSSDRDVRAVVYNGSTPQTTGINLSALEDNAGSGTLSLSQYLTGVECDGSKFVIAYFEFGAGSWAQYVASFDMLAGQIRVVEPHLVLPLPSATDGRPSGIVAQHGSGGPRARCLITSDVRITSTDYDIYGTFYNAPQSLRFCEPGGDAIACPCGNAPSGPAHGCNNSAQTGGAQIAAAGSPPEDNVVLGASQMLPTATCIFLQGSGVNTNGLAFGDGVRCVAGTLKRLYVKAASSGFAAAPGSGDPSIMTRSAALGDPLVSGAQRFYQVYYRDPATYACASPATFNITPTLLLEW